MTIRIKDEDLRLRTCVRFYRLFSKISRPMAEGIMGAIHAAKGSSKPHFTRSRLSVGSAGAIVDYTIVPYEDEPAFLQGTQWRENRLGLVLLVQYQKHACVALSGRITFSDKLIESIAERVGPEVIAETLGDVEKVQGLRCQSMAVGHGIIRARSWEGEDLSMSLSSMAMSRQVAKSVRVRKSGTTRTTNPSTALIGKMGPRATLQDFVKWVASEIDQMAAPAPQHPQTKPRFLDHFAQPIKRKDLPFGVQPTAVFLNLSKLEQGIADGDLAIFHMNPVKSGGAPEPIPDEIAMRAVEILGQPGIVSSHSVNADHATVNFEGFAPEFTLRANKQSYSIASRALRSIRIGARDGSDLQTITQWVNAPENQALFVATSDIQYAYVNGVLAHDRRVVGLMPQLLMCLRPVPALAACVSEKGEPLAPGSGAFPGDSVFGAIENTLASEDILVCDDLGDEWADYIGINTTTHTLTLYHAKHGSPTTSASAFQTLVGQAVKNLGKLGPVRDELAMKKSLWAREYHSNNVATAIQRIRTGQHVDAVVNAYESVTVHPARRQRVALVTSFLSRGEMEDSFDRVRTQRELRRHDPQRVWLLTSFMAACNDIGAEPILFCAP